MPERESNASKSGSFQISSGPVTSPSPMMNAPAKGELPMHYGAPQLLAVGRDPETLFVCWSVDWASLFAHAQPADQRAHLKVKSLDSGKKVSVAVEPMQGTCAVPNLQPGEKYTAEIGYYSPVEEWQSVALSNEVELAGATTSADTIDVATIPFHLTFERMLNMFRGSARDQLAEQLADFQDQTAQDEDLGDADPGTVASMNLSATELREGAKQRRALRDAAPLPEREPETFGGFSSAGGFGGSSPS